MKSRGPWKVKKSKIVYENRWISVREDHVLHPTGKPGIFGIVTMLPGNSIIPLDEKKNVYLVKEFCYAIGRDTFQAISGGIEKGETRLASAKRELEEEAGFAAKQWQYLGVVDPFTMVINSPNYIYLARGLSRVPSPPEEAEDIKIVAVPFTKALRWIDEGKITHSATCVALLKIARTLSSH